MTRDLLGLLAIVIMTGAVLTVCGLAEIAVERLARWRSRIVRRRLRSLARCSKRPWDGAIVREHRYFCPHWNARVGRAYRAMAAERRAD